MDNQASLSGSPVEVEQMFADLCEQMEMHEYTQSEDAKYTATLMRGLHIFISGADEDMVIIMVQVLKYRLVLNTGDPKFPEWLQKWLAARKPAE